MSKQSTLTSLETAQKLTAELSETVEKVVTRITKLIQTSENEQQAQISSFAAQMCVSEIYRSLNYWLTTTRKQIAEQEKLNSNVQE